MGSYLNLQQQRRDVFSPRSRAEEDKKLVQLGQRGAGGQLPIQPLQPIGGPASQQQAQPQSMAQQPMPVNESEAWQQTLGELNKGINQLDEPAKAKLNDLNLKTESLIAARSNLRDDEFNMAMKSVADTATDYAWEHHIKPPGSQPGDIVEEEGVRKLTQPDGSRVPVSYTPQFMAENAMPIGNTGKIAIPTSPTEPYEVVDAKDRDLAGERGEIDKAAKGIEKIYTALAKEYQAEKEVKDDDGKVIGMLPFTSSEQRMLSIQAADAYVKDQLQAKHAAKVIADTGTDEMSRFIGGDPQDPYKTEQDLLDQQREIVLHKKARRDAAKELMEERGVAPTPSLGPMPAADDDPDAAAKALLGALGSEEKTPEQKAQASLEYQQAMAVKQATADPNLDFTQKMVQGGSMRAPLKAPTKDAMNEMYADAPEGAVVELADNRRYIKDGGKFWQIPWSSKQLASPTMLDAEGDEIIDPATGEAAKGIVQQLDEGKYGMGGMQALPDEAAVAAHAAGNMVPVGRDQAARLNADQLVSQDMTPEQMLEAQQAADARQKRTQAQMRQPARQPGDAAEAVDPERTAAVAAGLDQSRLPKPQSHQPGMAVQEAEAERMRQAHDAGSQFDPTRIQAQYNKLVKDPAVRQAMNKPVKLRAGQSPDELPPGTAFIEPRSKALFYKLPSGLYLGPIDDDIKNSEFNRRTSVPQSVGRWHDTMST